MIHAVAGNKSRIVVVALALLTALGMGAAQAQPVTKFVTGSAPGAGTDTVTRLLAESMGPILGHNIIVENRPGASYTIAASYVAKAAPDGNTALLTFNVHPATGALHPDLPFDPVHSFRAAGKVATTPYAVVANPALPGSNLRDMIELARKEGRSLTFASIGLGTPQHLMVERLKQQTGVDIIMVHYSNASQGQIDVMAGVVDFMISTIAFCEPHVKAGKLKVMAVTSEQRLPIFPDAATVKETGYEGFITDGWWALLLPANTPDDVVRTYNDTLNQALALPSLREKFHAANLVPAPSTPDELGQLIEHDVAMWKKLIREQGIKPN